MSDHNDTPVVQPPTPASTSSKWTVQRIVIIAAAVLGGVIVLLFLVGLAFAIFSDAPNTASVIQVIRDLVIIVMALEFMVIIGALAILILQIARLINLLQNEVKPVLQNTQEAVNSARGTVEFVGNNVTQPFIRASGFLAGVGILFREVGGIRRAIRPTKEKQHESE